MSKDYIKANKVDCKEVKGKLVDCCEQFGSAKLSGGLYKHISGCRDCEIFYEHVVKVGFKQIEEEKNTEINPYFTTKTIAKLTSPHNPVFQKVILKKTSFYFTSVLMAGFLTGILINTLLLNVQEISTEQTIETDENNANTISDNATLTLNDW